MEANFHLKTSYSQNYALIQPQTHPFWIHFSLDASGALPAVELLICPLTKNNIWTNNSCALLVSKKNACITVTLSFHPPILAALSHPEPRQ